ncbi:hypothetical protein AVEN_68699-1 [Araneus ventricosus]|uniref:IRF tryptophan pentad repeat domain-containing protein n=1 Tax=Araneus ventricosus TaxID=182803 RepID=A0A4Y2VQS6_ARAVE|nr:hypothetical protein AVEN_68699-1 [Araneus ventricosus]
MEGVTREGVTHFFLEEALVGECCRMCDIEESETNIRLIQDFIVPALDEETYGDLLAWDSEPGVFKIKWTHKARSSWTEEDSRVFIVSASFSWTAL